MRITEIAKIKAKGMVAEKARFEFACVLPGITSSTPADDRIYVNEPRMTVALDMFNCKIKGYSQT